MLGEGARQQCEVTVFHDSIPVARASNGELPNPELSDSLTGKPGHMNGRSWTFGRKKADSDKSKVVDTQGFFVIFGRLKVFRDLFEVFL
jgi:hypothetical protein